MEERRLERTVRKNRETAERQAKERRLCCIYQCVNYKERKVRERCLMWPTSNKRRRIKPVQNRVKEDTNYAK